MNAMKKKEGLKNIFQREQRKNVVYVSLKLRVKGCNSRMFAACWRAMQAKKCELFVNLKFASDRNLNFIFNFNRLTVLFVYLFLLNNFSSDFDSLYSAGTGGLDAVFYCNKHATSKHHFLTFVLL